MRRVRGVVHGPAAGLSAPQKGGRPAREATLDRAATPRHCFFPYSPNFVDCRIPGLMRLSAPFPRENSASYKRRLSSRSDLCPSG
jgi:hypothetical protein